MPQPSAITATPCAASSSSSARLTPIRARWRTRWSSARRTLREAEFYAKVYADTSSEQIGRLRQASSMETGQALQLKTPIVNELNYQRNKVNRHLSQIEDQLKAVRLSEPERIALEAEKETLCGKDGQGGRLGDLVAMMGVFAKWRSSITFGKLTEERQAQLVEVMHGLERKYRERAEDARSQLDLIETNSGLQHALAGKTTLLYLTLDLTFGSDRMGFFRSNKFRGPASDRRITRSP